MSVLGNYGKAITKAPWVFISLILVITLVMGYFSQDFEQASEEDAFTPDDDVSKANQEVRDEFGSQRGQLTVLIKAEDKVLSRQSLLAQLELENRTLGSGVSDLIINGPDDPNGISSPAEIVVQSIFYTRSFIASQEFISNSSVNRTCLEEEKLINAFISKGFSLSIDEKRIVLSGGSIPVDIDCLMVPLFLEFQPYEPQDLPSYTEMAPMAVALEFLLSKE